MRELIFISAGLSTPKKGRGIIFRRQRYLNYGLLSLANSDMVSDGAVFHGHFDSPSDTLLDIEQSQRPGASTDFLISCPSFLALKWVQEFVELASRKFVSARFVLGGRWVVDGNVEYIRSRIPRIDHFFEGLGEARFSEFMGERLNVQYKRNAMARIVFDNTSLSNLNYKKLSNINAFVPSFEGSRGCGAGCKFCAEAAVRLTPLKPPNVICEEISQYYRDVPNGVRRFYLEASNFTPQLDWIESFTAIRQERGLGDVQWRAESRVDIFSQRSIEAVAQAGLKVLDLGMESASPQQLLRMGKSRNPLSYLERCARLIRTASDSGILIKLNILLFPGETEDTIAETTGWLEHHRNHFTGVSVYPTVYYGLTPLTDPTLEFYQSLGASLATVGPAMGMHHINLSSSIPYPESEAYAHQVTQTFMSDQQYFTLKSFSYFDPSYTEHEFRSDLSNSDPQSLPFKLTEWGRLRAGN